MRLSAARLGDVPGEVERPRYDPAAHGIGVVHLGIGAFHRAHQAVMFDDVIARDGGDWRVRGVSLRSTSVRDQLGVQDGLYTLVVAYPDRDRRRIVGAVADVIVAPEDPPRVTRALAALEVHLITLTVTEKGYGHDPATGALDWNNPTIAHDAEHPRRPVGAIGHLVAGLAARRDAGTGPVTILSCDNLPGNGALLMRAVLDLADANDRTLRAWIEANAAFPSTMVDRIVPATTSADRAANDAALGLEDAGMVRTEPFTQWVVEDRFAGPRPDLAAVGAQLVADVRPFELAKLRLLNGAHSTMAYLGLLKGHAFVHDAVRDPGIRPVVRALFAEAAATLPAVPELDPAAYADRLLERFANPALRHRLDQIATDGSQKLPQRLLGTIRDNEARGRPARAAALGVAAWLRHWSAPTLDDPLSDQLRSAGAAGDDQALLDQALGVRAVFGDLGDRPWFRALMAEALTTVRPRA